MTTIFRFPVPHHSSTDRDTLLVEHLEELLLLGHLLQSGTRRDPIEVTSSEFESPGSKRLFENPAAHFWSPQNVTTTKIELHNIRIAGNVDDYYDIDVLRMTEPRLLFIQRSLSRINQLPIAQRKNVLSKTRHIPVDTHSDDAINTAFQRHLSNVISNFELFDKNHQIAATSFKFRKFPTTNDEIFVSRVPSGENLFENFLESFNELIAIQKAGNKLVSFEIRNERDWLTNSQGEPFEVLGVLSRDCNAKCDFCYVLGNPNNTAIKLQKFTTQQSGYEAELRASYFQEGRTLPIATYDTEELMTHPKFFDICREIRRASSKCISITTNGYRINDESVAILKELVPVDISLSLNSQSPEIRSWLMGGPYARGVRALQLLDKNRIPAAVTIAAWPRVPISEIEATIRYAANFNIRSISVLLGGYTRHFPNPPEYPIPGYWNTVIDAISGLRDEISIPLIIQPRLYEEQYRFAEKLGACLITGINPKSAASKSGLRIYDEIVEIAGVAIATRNQCYSILALATQRPVPIPIRVLRKGGEHLFELNSLDQDSDYLYGLPFNDNFGLHLIGEGIRVNSIRRIFDLINAYRAKRPLFLTSMIVRPMLAMMLRKYAFLGEHDFQLDLQIVPNKFLGGNIIMGDMLVLDDFRDFLKSYISEQIPDLIMLPSGPFNHGGWLRDMKGQSFELLRRVFDVPIEMIEAPYFE